MATTVELLTPFRVSEVTELSASGGIYRKQVLRFGTINYRDRSGNTRKITFDRSYAQDLVRAYKDGAFSQVPFQLADADNRHTNAPDRTGGEVIGVELSADGTGLDALIRTWGPGHTVVELNKKLGVSARIIEGHETSDGRKYPRALQHVLGTVNPQIPGMTPWESVSSVDLAVGQINETVDLSNGTYGRNEMDKNGKVTLELSTAVAEKVAKLVQDDEAITALREAGVDIPEPADEPDLTDAEIDALLRADDEDEDTSDGETDDDEDEEETELSGQYGEALELAQAQIAAQGQQVVELATQLSRARAEADLERWRGTGLAPAVIEAALPLLTLQTGTVELSRVDGMAVDPAEVVRDVLNTVVELANSGELAVDLSHEEGHLLGVTSAEEGRRQALLDDWNNNYS